eukprot:scaffold19962_cov100-Phaeocystis_antarctica.AAC.1
MSSEAQRDYAPIKSLLRDGNGILQWCMSMHDIKQPEKQMALRADLQKTKFMEGENAQDFNAWMDGIMNGDTDAVQHVAAPMLGSFANFFGNSSNGDGETLSQSVYDEIARASAAAAELAFEAATNQVTPQPSSRVPNPALTPLPPITPI